jgi:hypothetical protein
VYIKDIVNALVVRNKITHQGRSALDNLEQLSKAFKVYDALMSILVRVFLAMLKYDKQYKDIWLGKWISFRDICSGQHT